MDNMSKNKPSASLTHVACESKLHTLIQSSVHACPGNWVAIVHAVVYNAGAAHAFSAVIEYRHCIRSGAQCSLL